MPTPMLMAKSGHTSTRTLSRYARPSADALAAWHAERRPEEGEPAMTRSESSRATGMFVRHVRPYQIRPTRSDTNYG